MKVKQELMGHASIQTTMNVYGRAMAETKRRANSQVVGVVFGPDSQSPEEVRAFLRPTMDRHSRSPSEILHHPSIAVLGIVRHGKKQMVV